MTSKGPHYTPILMLAALYRWHVRSSARSGVFGKLLGESVHVCIAEMECSGFRSCRENENILKMEVN